MSSDSAQNAEHIAAQSGAEVAVRRSYYAYPADEQAVASIMARYGCSTESDAVRLALRLVAGDAIRAAPQPAITRRVLLKFKSNPG